MANLIDELKNDHVSLVAALNTAKTLGITNPAGRAALMGAKKGLLAHLKKEDQQLYPALKRAALTDASLKRTLDVFAKDMDGISAAALGFFAKYENGGSGIEFAKDFGRLYMTLTQRISKEEKIIYAKFLSL